MTSATQDALARIDAALSRIELAIDRPRPNAIAADYAQLAARHDSLRDEAKAALGALDHILADHGNPS